TNKFHGDAFDYVRNDAFNANNYFSGFSPYKKYDFGFTIGGPVTIPGLYNKGKDKTFFFYSQEWRRDRVPGQSFNVAVPTCEERGLAVGPGGAGCTGTQSAFGNFSALCQGTTPPDPPGPGKDCPLNPFAVNVNNPAGTPFGNPNYSGSGPAANPVMVPIDPISVPLLALFPYPTSVT